MIRYAVVGAGWISQEAFMPGVAQSGNSTIAAIVTGDLEKGAKLAAFHNVPQVVSYDDYDALLASDTIDAVYIALPNSMHADYTIRAAKAGKHIMVEKPLAVSVEEGEAMIAAADAAGVFLMTAYRLHHEPGTVAVLDQIAKGSIGTPLIFQSVFSFQMAPGNHRLQAAHWGGPLQDVGVYCVNAARHIFGEEPIEATATLAQPADDPRFAEVEATLAATLRFPSGGLAQFICSFGAAAVDNYRVVGSNGDIELDPAFKFDFAMKMRLRRDGVTTAITFPQIDHFGAQVAYFSDCITAGTQPEADGAEGLADMRALLAIEAAARTGKPQPIQSPPRPRHPTSDMVRMAPVTTHRLLL
ncbi:MAG: putative glucose-fructose oxidoreductase oxidoreductase protein [Rhodobacteraceae bacterium]|nr:MAG: putative glucose-fructose oxidoreductase oxidoreductase protein [Paracoccaceae bacterium]